MHFFLVYSNQIINDYKLCLSMQMLKNCVTVREYCILIVHLTQMYSSILMTTSIFKCKCTWEKFWTLQQYINHTYTHLISSQKILTENNWDNMIYSQMLLIKQEKHVKHYKRQNLYQAQQHTHNNPTPNVCTKQ